MISLDDFKNADLRGARLVSVSTQPLIVEFELQGYLVEIFEKGENVLVNRVSYAGQIYTQADVLNNWQAWAEFIYGEVLAKLPKDEAPTKEVLVKEETLPKNTSFRQVLRSLVFVLITILAIFVVFFGVPEDAPAQIDWDSQALTYSQFH